MQCNPTQILCLWYNTHDLHLSISSSTFLVWLSSGLAFRTTFRGGSIHADSLPASSSQRGSAGEAQSREQSVGPGLPRFGHVEERSARYPAPAQRQSSSQLLSQEWQTGPGQRTAASTDCCHQTGLSGVRIQKRNVIAGFNKRWICYWQYYIWATRGQ